MSYRLGQLATGFTRVPLGPAAIASADDIFADERESRIGGRPLKRVEINNVRALRDVVLDFPEGRGDVSPWLVLLGENATGKTTILHSIALALAGAAEAGKLIRPASLLRVGASDGHVRLHFFDIAEPVELRFSRNSEQFKGTERPSAFVLGYGALRYAEKKRRRRPDESTTRLKTLLAPVARIGHPGPWLLALDDQRFDVAARVLQSLLPTPENGLLYRRGNRILFRSGDHEGSLAQLSAGYQTIVAMCADILGAIFTRWDTIASATGVVLIDELDAHLHPRWRMRIVSALREALPYIQFVVSTHDPLILRGIRNGEVALMRRGPQLGIVADQNLPPVEGMQVDQLLTSRNFGLASTLDPRTEEMLNELYHLLALPYDEARQARIEFIGGSVGDVELLGRNRREQMMLKVAGEYLDATQDDGTDDVQFEEQTLQRLRAIVDKGSFGSQQS